MRVLHTGTLDVNIGGPSISLYGLVKGLQDSGIATEVFMYKPDSVKNLIGTDIRIHFASSPYEQKFQYSSSYKKELLACGEYDLYHAHGIWQYPTYALVDVVRKKKKPYVITPRGMLYPQDIQKSNRLLKHFSLKIGLLDDLNKAACIHVTSEDEMNYCRELGVTSPIAVIPNPIEIKDYSAEKLDDVFRIGYLGRLHSRKRIEKLIYVIFEISSEKQIELVIIGGGDPIYEKFLRNEVKRLNLTNVRFSGFLTGEEKEKELSSLSLLVLPSDFENFGNVIIEGLIRGIPCIATKGAPWKELNDYSCGWWVDNDLESIKKAIEKALSTEEKEMEQMGERGKMLVKSFYSIESVASKMKQLYTWILNKEEKPEFIYHL